jgi:hypothetical protein
MAAFLAPFLAFSGLAAFLALPFLQQVAESPQTKGN